MRRSVGSVFLKSWTEQVVDIFRLLAVVAGACSTLLLLVGFFGVVS